jgi:hypothetical protein
MLMAAGSTALQARAFLARRSWLGDAESATPDLVRDTFNGLLAFIVPGPDAYSVSQGVSTVEAGGIDAGGIDALIATLDQSTPFLPQFSSTVAAVLNGLANTVNPAAAAPFASSFANLAFAEKATVFQIMDATDSLAVLSGVLPALVAAFTYSEGGAFDAATRSLIGSPVGWQIAQYQGVADGRDEFRGYFRLP